MPHHSAGKNTELKNRTKMPIDFLKFNKSNITVKYMYNALKIRLFN